MEQNALGLCDYANKKIPLASGQSAAEVALTLKHELQHMEDIKNGMNYGLSDTPRSAILLNRVLEGNARVSEAVAAAEAMMGSAHGPARQFRTAALFNEFWRACPQMAQEADSALKHAAEGKWTQFAANVLPAYFRETPTLAAYDERYYKFIDKYVPDVSNSVKAAKDGEYQHRAAHQKRIDQTRSNANTLFTQDRWTAETVAPLLTIRGLPYMKDIAQKSFSLAGDAAISLTAQAPALFEKLKQSIRTVLPESEKPALLDLPLQKGKPLASAPPNPYGHYTSKLETESFSPIRLPDRIDGSKLTNGMRSNESTTQIFTEAFQKMKSGATDTDRINYVVDTYLAQNGGVANVRGLVGNLLDAGLLAPIGAFPEKYLFDLYKRVTLSTRMHVEGRGTDISPQEAKLLDHWQQLQNKGMDPVWIDAANQKASWVAHDGSNHFYENHLRALLKEAPAASTAKPAPASAAKV